MVVPKPTRRRHLTRVRKLLRWTGRLLGGLVVILVLLLGGAATAVWWTLPPRDGRVALPGLAAPVEIGFDAQGIPTVMAQSEGDAWTALGWLHARDRMFQMDSMRRGASGRLAEVAGSSALRLDRYMRVLGLVPRAEADLAALSPEVRAAMEAYARGVNAWIAARGRFAAPEFLALGAPEPWRPVDSLLWGKVMGLWLSGNWRTELDRARLAGVLPPERLDDLWPADTTPGRPDLPGLTTAGAARLAMSRRSRRWTARRLIGWRRRSRTFLSMRPCPPWRRTPGWWRGRGPPPARRCSRPTLISATRRRSCGTWRASNFPAGAC